MEATSYQMEAEVKITKETVNEQGLIYYSNVLKTKDTIFIALTKEKAKIPISIKSGTFILRLASQYIEEFVLFSHYLPETRIKAKRNSLKDDSIRSSNKNEKLLPNLDSTNSKKSIVNHSL